ncbi:hypothetical protein AAY473_023926 [Plecturocebus cupreus]
MRIPVVLLQVFALSVIIAIIIVFRGRLSAAAKGWWAWTFELLVVKASDSRSYTIGLLMFSPIWPQTEFYHQLLWLFTLQMADCGTSWPP